MFALEQWVQGSESFFVLHRSLVNVTLGALVVTGVLVKIVVRKNSSLNLPGGGWLVIALIGYAFVSLAWVERVDLSSNIWLERFPYIVVFIFLSPFLIVRIDDFQRMYQGVLVLGTLLTLLLLFTVEWNFRFVILKGEDGSSLFGNPLAPAEVAGNVACIALLYRFEKWQPIWKVIKWLVVAACIMLILKSGSRGQLLGFFAALLVGATMNKRNINIAGIVTVCLSASILAMGTFWLLDEFLGGSLGGNAADNYYDKYAMQHRWEVSDMEDSFAGRLENVFLLLDVWSKSVSTILFGLGNSASYNPNLLGIYPHFVPGEILAEEGLIGIALYIALLIITFSGIKRSYLAVRERDFARSLLAITVTLFVYSFFISLKQGSLLGNLPFLLWVMMLGRFENAVTRWETDTKSARKSPKSVHQRSVMSFHQSFRDRYWLHQGKLFHRQS